jgi:predicted nucleotidyltransferase component of viral defense system
MSSPIETMLEQYNCQSMNDYRNALQEIIQEIVLLGLSRSGFFQRAAFYGGTALRIFYKLNRYSEDLDFSMLSENKEFNWKDYLPNVQNELASYGFELAVEPKIKSFDSQIHSAFVKGDTAVQLVKILPPEMKVPGYFNREYLRIKLEVDTAPPEGANYEVKYQLLPIPYSVQIFDKPSLFAGKVHALLCRNWATRIKGRDFYDYIWYLSQQVPLNLRHLEIRMLQSKHLESGMRLDSNDLLQKLIERFSKVDLEQAKKDVLPFLKNTKELELWSQEFFITVTKEKLKIKNELI